MPDLRSRSRLWLGVRVLCLAAVCAAGVVASVALLRAPGVDRLRLTVLWSSIAPDPLGANPPAGWGQPALGANPPAGVDPSQPGAYAAAAWAPYDRVAAALATTAMTSSGLAVRRRRTLPQRI